MYIAEAHAIDEWPMGEPVPIKQAQSLSDRVAAASKFQKETGFTWPMLADGMDNSFHKTFGAWPTRYYVIHKGKLALKIEHKDGVHTPNRKAYDIHDIRSCLDRLIVA